jgi:hypothetical protein
MALGILTLNDTFQLATVTRLNSLILLMNELTEGQANSTGIITLTGGGFRDNVTMNVANGQIKGDGGAIVNVGASFTKISGQANNTLIQNNFINLISNSVSLSFSGGNVAIGSRVFANLTIVPRTDDTSTSNIGTNFGVNAAMNVAVAAFASANAGGSSLVIANLAYDKANAANQLANGAFLKANVANTRTVGNTLANGYYVIRSSQRSQLNFLDNGQATMWTIADDSAGDRINLSFTSTVGPNAYDKANTANITADFANAAAAAAFANSNTNATKITAAFARANADFISLILNGALTAYNNINVVPYCVYAFQIDSAYYRIDAGTSVRIQVRNGSTNVTNLSALTAVPGPNTNTATGLNTFAVGDRLQITLTNQTSSEKNLEMVFAITRT